MKRYPPTLRWTEFGPQWFGAFDEEVGDDGGAENKGTPWIPRRLPWSVPIYTVPPPISPRSGKGYGLENWGEHRT